MAVWSSRPSGYKLGVLLLFLASAFYLVGYASPFWLHSRAYSTFSGLWLVCYKTSSQWYSSDETKCVSSKGNEDSWFKAVQAMESIGLIAMIICCVYALVANCCQRAQTRNRVLEILAASGGVSGFIGCMVFVGKTQKEFSEYYGWAFGVNLTGCILLVLSAIIIFITNKETPDAASSGGVVTFAGGVPAQGVNVVYPPAGPQGQVYPPAGPQGQVYPPAGPQSGYIVQPAGYGQPQVYSGGVMYPYMQGTAPPQAGYTGAPSAPHPSPQYSASGYNQAYSGQAGSVPEK